MASEYDIKMNDAVTPFIAVKRTRPSRFEDRFYFSNRSSIMHPKAVDEMLAYIKEYVEASKCIEVKYSVVCLMISGISQINKQAG